MKGLYYWIRWPNFMRNRKGIRAFADLCIASCLRAYARGKRSLAARIQRLKEEGNALRAERLGLGPATAPSYEETSHNTKQLRFEQVLWLTLVFGEAVLTYFAALAFLHGAGILRALARGLIALVATTVAVVVAEKFIGELLARRETASPGATAQHRRRAWMWATLLVGLEVSLWGIASVRAADMEGSTNSPLLLVGLTLLSVLLPPAAGGVRHDLMMRFGPVRRAQRIKAIDDALENNSKALHAARHELETDWEECALGYHSRFADFQMYKENYNAKRQIEESTAGAFFDTREGFCDEARRQRDLTYGEHALLNDDDSIVTEAASPVTLVVQSKRDGNPDGPRRLLA